MGENTALFISSFLRAATPMISGFINSRIDNGLKDNQHRREMQLLEKQEEILNKQSMLENGSPPADSYYLPKVDKFQFMEGEEVDDLGQRMWNETHAATLQIPDNAKPHEVRKVMREIETAFRNHPCSECKEHARQNLQKVPLVKGINNKHEAVERLYEFHNTVNDMLEKPEFTRTDFERQYNYKL